MSRSSVRGAQAALLLLGAPLLLSATGSGLRFEERLLAAHNRERTASGLAPMTWSSELVGPAARWAEHLARTGQFDHEPITSNEAPGENLWAGTPDHFEPEQMVGHWIEEKKYYKPGRFPDNSHTGNVADVGHYTQIMWSVTHEVGCAIAKGRREDVLVCRYRRPGNIVGRTPF